MSSRTMTLDEWRAEGRRRFGSDASNWKFVCPSCGRVNTGAEFKAAGASPEDMYQECIGRWEKTIGCNWAAYGFFDICTLHVDIDGSLVPVFEFAEGSVQA